MTSADQQHHEGIYKLMHFTFFVDGRKERERKWVRLIVSLCNTYFDDFNLKIWRCLNYLSVFCFEFVDEASVANYKVIWLYQLS